MKQTNIDHTANICLVHAESEHFQVTFTAASKHVISTVKNVYIPLYLATATQATISSADKYHVQLEK